MHAAASYPSSLHIVVLASLPHDGSHLLQTDTLYDSEMAQPLVEVLDQVEQILRNAFSLTKLNRVPGISQINPLLHTHDPSRSLSIYDESDVANNLAFLAAVTDDPSQVMAVCVEERPDYQGMIIRIATNTGELLDVKTGFENIANVLEITTRRGL